MKSLRILPLLLLVTLAAAPAPVEMTAEPAHHLALQNQYVRVFQVEVAPHAATLLHVHHHDYVFVTLGLSRISNEVLGKPPIVLPLQEGEVRATDGNFAHLARNVATTPFRNVTIEFLQDEKARSSPPAAWDDDRSLQVLHGGTQQILFVKDGVRVSETELQVAGSVPRHHHAHPHLVVAVTDLNLRNDVVGKGVSNVEMKSGDIKWIDAGVTHSLTNVGAGTAKFVTLEFP